MNMRIGHGFDIHKFTVGDHVMLGGVRIPYIQGILAHSDGDVVLHALADALLGAAGLGDIGQHFPPSDPQFKGIDSRLLLRKVVQSLLERGFRPGNVDVTVVAEAPKIGPYREQMQENIAQDLAIPVNCVNIKGTTMEGLDAVGQRTGIAAHAVAVILSAAKDNNI